MKDKSRGYIAQSLWPRTYRLCSVALFPAEDWFKVWPLAGLFVHWPLVHSVPQICCIHLTLDSGVEAGKIPVKCVII